MYLEYSFFPSLLLAAVAAPKIGGGVSYMKPMPPPFLVRIPGGCPDVRMADMMSWGLGHLRWWKNSLS